MSIYNTAVNKPISTLMVFLAILVLGVFSYVQLPVDQYPKMDPPYITVMATYPGANASDIEENVTKILEDQLNSVDDLKELTSTSYDNLAVISLEFEWEANLDEASNDVRDAVDKAMSNLPDDIDRPTIMRFNTSMMPILIYAVTAQQSYPGLNKILDDKLVTRLNRVDGVASVTLAGAPERVVYVEVDPNQMDAYNLTLEQVGNKILAENKDVPSGNVKMGLSDYTLRVEGEFEESDQIKDIVLGTQNDKTIYLRDIAKVRDTLKDITLEQSINRGRGGVLLITKQTDANAVQIAKQVKKELAIAQKDLPTDINFEIIVDNSDFIVKSINNLQDSLMYALIFVVLVVFLFLGRWRATFIIALTIPISLIVAFIYLFATGESLNVISLSSLSIAIGMVVDDAIVVLENVTKHIDRGSRPREAAKYGTNEVWLSVIVTTLVTVAVFFPLTLVTGMTGILFKQLGWIVCITVCTSTATAISLTPMLCSQLLKIQEVKDNGKFSFYAFVTRSLDKLDAWYERLIRWVLTHKIFVISLMLGIFIGSCSMMRYIKTDFMPQNDQGSMSVYVKMQTGQRVEESKRVAFDIDSVIRTEIPEVTIINLSYGSEEEASFASMMNSTGNNILNMRVRVKDVKERDRDIFVIADQLRDILKRFPDILEYTVSTSSNSMTSNTVDIEIMGHDFDMTSRLANEIANKARQIPGAEDIKISRDNDKPEMRVYLDRDKLARHGLTTTEVGNALRNRIYGYRNSKFKEDGEEYDIIVRFEEKYRSSLTELENILITDGKGEKVRLKELGEIKEYYSPPNIERKSKQRMLKVSISPKAGVAMGEIATAAQQMLDNLEDVPQEVSLYIGGGYEDQQESFSSLFMLLLLSLMLVYIVMAAQFESFKMPFIIMLSIPFAFSGVILALLITHTTLSVIAALGAIMLIGIVTKNGIVLIDFINLMRERGVRLYDAIAQACRSRLRPVLMTSLTTILGMVPMALSVGEGSETWRPMGVAVIGGMVFSTIITLLIVPVVYASMDKSGSRDKKKALSKQFKFMSDFDPEKDLPKK
ncbi:efflux RND transporter permease subunit [Odoribacter laneus]|uniref:efflux RND transporter permease subunit n=1 Tax=Odoribacter laneus TaxID=626933 RepID=UPI000340E333|nr:efflux RND transporter permease subunit [Odoribacter laneus]CCZ81399.1 hydrophobe/amphiphile efflux-1 (HAE1) family RND transporter [Odoribacter laneus CAG:561]